MFLERNKNLKAFATGEFINIENVEDEVFSNKMMGDGLAIKPQEGKIYAPCEGFVKVIFEPTHHAIGIQTKEGMEILIHVGLETVNIKDDIFDSKVQVGDRIKSGDLLIDFDKEQLDNLGYNSITMLVILDDGALKYNIQKNDKVKARQTNIIELF